MRKLLAALALCLLPFSAWAQQVANPVPYPATAGTSGQPLCSLGTTPSTSNWCSHRQAVLMASSAVQAQSLTRYYPCSGTPGGGNATEANVTQPIPFGATAKNLYVVLTVAPAGSDTIIATLRVNSATPGSGPVVTVTGAAVTGNDTTHTATFTAGQTCDIMVVSSATAASTAISAGLELDNP